ncbi:MAG: ApaLI family restriction endonuclease [Planctomycetaceae bacterium]
MAKRKRITKKKGPPRGGIEEAIRLLARKYADRLKKAVDERLEEMRKDDRSHSLIYQVLGVGDEEGRLVDEYQNKGRFLYNYAGSFLEEAAKLCFLEAFPDSGSVRVPNTLGRRPKTFEIDCLVASDAIEIKWRDATTDGDHITKEHTRIRAIVDAGHTPIRVMFYYPNRAKAIEIQQTLETLYQGVDGEYHSGDAAWRYMHARTGVDLFAILTKLARENAPPS